MDNKFNNKQVTMKTVVAIADYLENIKDQYIKNFQIEETKNKNLKFGDENYKLEYGSAEIKYTLEFVNGQRTTEIDYSWFVTNLQKAREIKTIDIDIYVRFYSKKEGSTYNDVFNSITANIRFRENDIYMDVGTENQEKMGSLISNQISSLINGNEARFDSLIARRKLRIQSFTISIGIILSYIIYILLKVNIDFLPENLKEIMESKTVLVYGQWFIAIILGNMMSYWYILELYRPLLPAVKYSGYNSSTGKSTYTDDKQDFMEKNEVHIGKYFDAQKRRNKIDKIYGVCKKIVLTQIIITMFILL